MFEIFAALFGVFVFMILLTWHLPLKRDVWAVAVVTDVIILAGLSFADHLSQWMTLYLV